jgi:hypothetical protein
MLPSVIGSGVPQSWLALQGSSIRSRNSSGGSDRNPALLTLGDLVGMGTVLSNLGVFANFDGRSDDARWGL